MKNWLRGLAGARSNGMRLVSERNRVARSDSSRRSAGFRPVLELLEARLTPAFTQLPSLLSGTPGGTATGNGAASVGVARTVSSDGRYEVFSSAATNLVAGLTDSNGGSDVFVRDLLTGVTSLVSINSAGTGTGSVTSDSPTISADGRYVAFRSAANNLAAPATNSQLQIFRRDLQTNTTVLVTVNSAGTNGGNAGTSTPSLSSDGNRIAFVSTATDMVTGLTDTNASNDVFVRNVTLGTTVAASVNPAGTATGNGGSDQPIVSDDGLSVAFRSSATDLVVASDNNQTNDIFVRSLSTSTTTLISRVSTTPGTVDALSSSFGRSISNDGRYEVFSTSASDVVAGLVDGNGATDVFIRDLQTGAVQAVSMNAAGTSTASTASVNAVISGDGRYVAFRSNATNLQGSATNGQGQIYRWDRLTNTNVLVSVNSAGTNGGNQTSDNPSISTDGSRIAYTTSATDLLAITDTNGVSDVYARNLTTNTTVLASVNSAGTATGNATSTAPVICGDGSAVAFVSQANNLVAGVVDTNSANDVFLRNLNTNTTSVISIASATTGTISAASSKQGRSISSDGRFEVFSTVATNVVPGLLDFNNLSDVFVRDLVNQTTSLVSVNLAGTGPSSGQSDTAVITPDGRYVVFRSNSNDLTAFGGNGVLQLYRRDLQTNTTILVTVNSAGTGLSNSSSDQPSISDDGSRVAYRTTATNLVTGVTDANGTNDIVVRDVGAGVNLFVSVNPAGTGAGSNTSQNPTIAGNGGSVIFESLSTDLVASVMDNNSAMDVFSRNLSTSTTSLVSVQTSTAGTSDLSSTRNNRSISSDGRYHVYLTGSFNVVSNIPDRNGVNDVFLYDVVTGTTTLVSVNRFGTGSANAGSTDISISGNGQYVFFRSTANDLTVEGTGSQSQVFRWDRLSNTTVMVSLNSTGAAGGNASVFGYSTSADGNIVAFDTSSTNIVTGLGDFNTSGDVFVRNISAGTTVCASLANAGFSTANGASSQPVVSANGTAVAFRSQAVNLTGQTDGNAGGIDVYVRNVVTNTTTLVSVNNTGAASGNAASNDRVTISDDGNRVAFGSDATNLLVSVPTTGHQVFVRDISSALTVLVSQSTGGAAANGASSDPILSGNGRHVVFTSLGTNLEATVTDSNGANDIFRRDMQTLTTLTISVSSGGTTTANFASALSTASGVSNDGNIVVFTSLGTNLVAGLTDGNGATDAFVRNVSGGTTACLNISTTPATVGNGFSNSPYVSNDGSRVIFETTSSNLLAGIIDFNAAGTDVYSYSVSGGNNTLVSGKSTAVPFAGCGSSDTAFVSFDGQKVLFRSSAWTLVVNDTNLGVGDVFLRNLTASTTSLVSVNLPGTGSGSSTSTSAGLTPNGQFALFLSNATDLVVTSVSGQSVYRRDLNSGTTILVTFNFAGTAGANGSTDAAVISDNGNIVAVRTFSTNIVAGVTDGNGTSDIVYRNISTATNFLASRDLSGTSAANSTSTLPVISGDGSRIAFDTTATNLLAGFVDFNGTSTDIYAVATASNVNQLVSIHATGGYTADATSDSFSISDNGLRVAFRSFSANLVDNDSNGGSSDVFVRDLGTSSTILVSINLSVTGSANSSSLEPAISSDGRYVAFSSTATDLAAPDTNFNQDIYRRDLQTNTTILISFNSVGNNGGSSTSDQPTISSNGGIVVFRSFSTNLTAVTDSNSTGDVFLRDIAAATTRMLSVNSSGSASANGASSAPLISGDGSRAIFNTQASDLLLGMLDYNLASNDIYAHSVGAATNALVSVRATDLRAGNSSSSQPAISANGLRVVYQSNAGNLVDIDLSTNTDVFVRDLSTNTTILVSVNPGGTAAGNGTSNNASITPDGRYVVFEGSATNLSATTDGNGTTDVFRRDLQTNTTLLISVNSAGTAAATGGVSDQASISDDGNFVAFRSLATNVVVGDTNAFADIFVRDVVGNSTSIVSKNGATQANGASSNPALAGNGTVVVFLSSASNLVTGATDANANTDLFAGFRDPPLALDVIDVSPDPRATPVSGVQVVLNRVVNPATFDFNDLSLTLNGGSNLITNVVTVSYISGTTYQINNLFGFTSNAGTYLLTVNMSAVSDPAGNLGAGSASDTWVLTLTQPSVIVVGPVAPDPRNTAVPFVDAVMSEVVNLATFDFNDLSLTRNGGSNLIDNTVTVTFVSGTTYRIGNLTTLTTPDGVYVLTVDATGIQNPGGASGTGTGSDGWTMDTIAPKVVGVFFNGTFDSDGAGSADNVWSAGFRTAAGNATLGYPAQTGAGQLTSMPWSTIDTIHIKFSENVAIASVNLGLRGINVATYTLSNFSYDSVNFIATWTISANIDTDRLIVDLDGDGGPGAAVADPTGNALAGTWTESSSTFPTAGAAGVDFKYRFVVAVGDADRNGFVRNPDTNLVRANLFVDAGAGGYDIYRDIDGNGQTRNADVNAVRSHLFVDPPSGPGPFRPVQRGDSGGPTRFRNPARGLVGAKTDTADRISAIHRRLSIMHKTEVLDELFTNFA